MTPELTEQEQQWLARGVDIWMLRDNLRLTPEERVVQTSEHIRYDCFLAPIETPR